MRDITAKTSTLRTARAKAFVSCLPATVQLILDNGLPKGDFRDFCKAAAFLGAKHTQLLIPHCHPVTIDGMSVDFEVFETTTSLNEFDVPAGTQGVLILSEAKSIGRTGIEMEVLTGISMAALTLYDLLKPVDKTVEISGIKLLEKQGGKSDRVQFTQSTTNCGLIICSDSVLEGKKEVHVGHVVEQELQGMNTNLSFQQVIGEEVNELNQSIQASKAHGLDVLFIAGGSSIGKRDLVAGTVNELLEGEAPGIIGAIEQYAYARTPLMMLSHLTAGFIGSTLVITIPGSQQGAEQALKAILPAAFKAKKMIRS